MFLFSPQLLRVPLANRRCRLSVVVGLPGPQDPGTKRHHLNRVHLMPATQQQGTPGPDSTHLRQITQRMSRSIKNNILKLVKDTDYYCQMQFELIFHIVYMYISKLYKWNVYASSVLS